MMKRQYLYAVLAIGIAMVIPASAQKGTSVPYSTDTLAIISYNDFHGAFASDARVPGAACLVQTILREKRKYPLSIVVSGGDNFSGSYFSKITKGKPIQRLYELTGTELSAVGNHEFYWGLPYLADTACLQLPHIAANITVRERNSRPDWLTPYRIVERELRDGSIIRIAFVGLTTTETTLKSLPENLKGLRITDPTEAARIQTAALLEQEMPVDMVVLLSHIRTKMHTPYCIQEDNAKDLPRIKGIDAIISAHSHEVVLDKVNDVPIIQAGVNGSHIGELLFQIQDHNGRRSISFLRGDTIRVSGDGDPAMKEEVEQIMRKYHLSDTLAVIREDLIHDHAINLFEYTPVGALVTASYAAHFLEVMPEYRDLPVIGVNHYGGIRGSLPKGAITRLKAGNVLPFGSPVEAYVFDGKRLKKLLESGRKSPFGFLQTADLALTLEGDSIKTVIYTKGGRNSVIGDDTPCVVVLDAYLAHGGDQYDVSLFKGHEILKFNERHDITTDAFMDFLKSLKEPITMESTHIPVISK